MPGEKFTVERHVGGLLEARVFALWSNADAEDYARKLQLVARALPPGVKPLLLADHRPVRVYPESVADRLVELFTHMNLKLERAALVVLEHNAPLSLQLQRLVDRADYSKRRLFTAVDEALRHVEPVLSDAERVRAAEFLASWTPSAP